MCTSTWSGEKTVPATIATVGTACTSAMVPAVLHNLSQKADMCARWSHSCAQRLRAAQWTVTSGYQRKINFWTPPPVQGLLKVLKFLEVHKWPDGTICNTSILLDKQCQDVQILTYPV
jgi:hypothetical protein